LPDSSGKGISDFPPEWLEFIESLSSNKVEFLVIGAHALAFHHLPRATEDIDFLVRPDLENGERIVRALRDFGFGSLGLRAEDFIGERQVIQLGYPPRRIDILTGISGVDFMQAWENKVSGEIEGRSVFFIGAKDFIINKRASARPKDLGDAGELENALREKE
jgi:hypothetical protein